MKSLFSIGKIIISNLLQKPSTLMYPIKKRDYASRSRGKITIKIEDCIFCGMCSRKCPTNALKVDREKKRWGIDRLKCITCNYCVEVCPKKCLFMDNHYTIPMLTRKKESYQPKKG